MSHLVVLDPTGPPPQDDLGPGADAESLAHKVVGVRLDKTWRSFEWVVDEWTETLGAAGASVRLWWAGNRIGERRERTARELHAFAAEVDLAVVGAF